jgi:hypothetical protein
MPRVASHSSAAFGAAISSPAHAGLVPCRHFEHVLSHEIDEWHEAGTTDYTSRDATELRFRVDKSLSGELPLTTFEISASGDPLLPALSAGSRARSSASTAKRLP